jgi:hypothetical protein
MEVFLLSTNTGQFLVSVADAVLRDTTTDQIVLKGKTLISSALTQAVNNQEVRGGFGNGLQYDFNFEKKLSAKIEDSRFDESYIALNNGTNIVSGLKNFYIQDEIVTLSSGSGVVANTPVGNLYVQKADNSIATIVPSGSNFSVAGGANTTVKVSYRTSTTVDSITIDADNYPKAYELVLTAKLFQKTGQTGVLQIVIPQFQVSGNFELSMTASGVSTSALDGKALINESDNAYAYVYIKPVGASAISYQALAATPSPITLTAGSPTKQITAYGIRGGNYSNVTLAPADCSYVSSTPATATVNASGLVTRVAAGSSTITITHSASGLTDVIPVTAT